MISKFMLATITLLSTAGCSVLAPQNDPARYQTYDLCYALGYRIGLEADLAGDGGRKAILDELEYRNLDESTQMQCRQAQRNGSIDRSYL